MIEDNFQLDPNDYAKYAFIEDVLNNKAYVNKKVRVLGTVFQNDKQARKIFLAHNNAKIECIVPDEFINIAEENQACQVIGVVQSLSPYPIISATIIKPLNSIDQSAYDLAVQKFNEFVFQ